MKSTILRAVLTLVLLLAAGHASSIDQEAGRYAKPPGRPHVFHWPDGLAAVIAEKSYLDGFNYQNPGLVVENVDTFYYGGNTEALNEFLDRLAKIKRLRVNVAFSAGQGEVNRLVRAGVVRQLELITTTSSVIRGQACSWLVSVTPEAWDRKSTDEARAKAEARVVVFLGDKRIDPDKLQLPSWEN